MKKKKAKQCDTFKIGERDNMTCDKKQQNTTPGIKKEVTTTTTKYLNNKLSLYCLATIKNHH